MASSYSASIERELLNAVDEFKNDAKLSAAELAAFQFTTLDDLNIALLHIQNEQSKTKRLRYIKRLDPFLNTMKEYGKVIEIFVNTSNILAFVWGPMKFVLLVASTFSSAFSSLLDAYETIGEQIPLLQSYQSLFAQNVHMCTILVMIFKDILSFHLEAVRYFKQNVWRQIFQATWKTDFLSKLKILKDNLSRHRQLIESRASLVMIEEIRQNQSVVEAKLRELKSSRRRAKVLQWLSPATSQLTHESHVAARASNPNAGKWILTDQRFKNWFDPLYCTTPLLWLNGKPGAGKSVLASCIIDEARTQPQISVAFFYCKENDPNRQTFVSVARGVLAQLLPQFDSSLLIHTYDKMVNSGEVILSSVVLAKDLLTVALRARKCYVIIDGVDECPRDQRKEICGFFRNLVDNLPPANMDEIRCLFVSQDDGIGRKDLSMLPTIAIKPEDNHLDIEEFSRSWETRIEEKFGPLPRESLDIAKVVPAMSQGMFIFAKCVLEEMFEQVSQSALLAEWQERNFPANLDEVYQRILKRLSSTGTGPNAKRHNYTKKLLAWISCAKRPLRWYEIQCAISVNLEEETTNTEIMRPVENAKDLCASLVEVHSDQTVELVHPTLKEFLKRGQHKLVFDPIETDRELVSLSIAYLCFHDISSVNDASDSDIETSLIEGRYAFYDYAVASWTYHLLEWLPHAKAADILDLSDDVETFLELHYSEPAVLTTISKTMQEKLKGLEALETCYASLAEAIIFSRKLMLADSKMNPDGQDILAFPKITSKIRSVWERVAEFGQASAGQKLEKYYGAGTFFKCPKIYCQYFYMGFLNRDDRDHHVDRHDRPYTCPFEDCTTATFGCISRQDLERHMLQAHGIQVQDRFPDPPSENPQHKRVLKNATFQCTLCPKRFTRAYTLRAHLRTHTAERPFVCTVCGKSFTRQHDRKRHEGLHSGEKKFVCKGDLSDGSQWGCGLRFVRADALGRHFRSEAGRVCIKPLFDEEILKRSIEWAATRKME